MIRLLAPYLIGGAITLTASLSLYGWGYKNGRQTEAARIAEAVAELQSKYDAQADAARKLESARLQTERRLNDALDQIEAEAMADPDAGSGALGAASVQRLNRIRRPD